LSEYALGNVAEVSFHTGTSTISNRWNYLWTAIRM